MMFGVHRLLTPLAGTAAVAVAAAVPDAPHRHRLQPFRGRSGLEWLTVWGPAAYLTLLAVVVLYEHPHPLPPFWPAFFLLLMLSAAGTFAFSRFVFAHVRRQEREIVRRTQELSEAREQMVVVKERQRIAREFHDSLAQRLGYLHLSLAELERRLAENATIELRPEVSELKKSAREAYEEARQAILGLRSMVSRSLGFIPSLTEYLHDWSRQTGIAVDLTVTPEEGVTVPPAVEVHLIGIIQEALANVRKHARAQHVSVAVDSSPTHVALTIRDDGVGFDPTPVSEQAEPSFGIAMMRERAEVIRARFRIRSARGDGTTVEVRVGNGRHAEVS